jgi:hypothetical protein
MELLRPVLFNAGYYCCNNAEGLLNNYFAWNSAWIFWLKRVSLTWFSCLELKPPIWKSRFVHIVCVMVAVLQNDPMRPLDSLFGKNGKLDTISNTAWNRFWKCCAECFKIYEIKLVSRHWKVGTRRGFGGKRVGSLYGEFWSFTLKGLVLARKTAGHRRFWRLSKTFLLSRVR